MSSYASTAAGVAAANRRTQNISVLMFVSGFLSILLSLSIATGWLALGERINISRRDFNTLEIVLMIGALIWGGLTIWVAANMNRDAQTNIRRYFDGLIAMPPSVIFVTFTLGILGLGCTLIALQVLSGWLPFGARINISRRDLNWIEWGVTLITGFWGILCWRTVFGFIRRESPAWSWGQWALLISGMVGIVIFFSGMFDAPKHIPARWLIPSLTIILLTWSLNKLLRYVMNLDSDRSWTPVGILVIALYLFYVLITQAIQFAGEQGLPVTTFVISFLTEFMQYTVAGILISLGCFIGYACIITGYGEADVRKTIAGTLSERAKARDVRTARVPADQVIRNQLAKSPGSGAIIGFVALFMFFSIGSDLFLQPTSLAGALTNNVTRGIVAIGATMLMISGEFDLSVGSLLGIAGLTFLGLMTGQFPPGGPQLDPVTAAIFTLIIVGFLGSLNGLLLIRTGIPSFIVTLATQLMLRGIPLVFIAGGQNLRYVDYFSDPPNVSISRIILIGIGLALFVFLLPVGRVLLLNRYQDFRQRLAEYPDDDNDFRTLVMLGSFIFLVITGFMIAVLVTIVGLSVLDQISLVIQGSGFLDISFFDLANGRIASLPFIGEISRDINLRIGVFWWFLLVIIFQFVLNQTRYGNATFAAGGNPGAALAQGINVNRTKVMNYILVAVMAAIAGILDASRLQSIDALRGRGLELEVIAATVIGGALLSGGYGSIVGALLGVFIFGMMSTGLVLIGVDARLFDAFIGAIILMAVIINNWSRRVKS